MIGNTYNKLLRAMLAAGFILAISACATAPTNISNVAPTGALGAAPGTSNAVIVIAMGYIGTAGQYDIRRVDLDAGQFEADVIPITFAVWGVGDVMRRAPSEEGAPAAPPGSQIALLVRQVPAGDYAFTGMTWNTFNGYASGTVTGCFKDGGVVVRVAPGSISFVNSGNVVPPGAVGRLPANTDSNRIREAFESARVNYPALQGEPVEADIVGNIQWRASRNFFGDYCSSGVENFVATQGNEAEIEAARAAAIAAARQNLTSQPAPEPSSTPNQ